MRGVAHALDGVAAGLRLVALVRHGDHERVSLAPPRRAERGRGAVHALDLRLRAGHSPRVRRRHERLDRRDRALADARVVQLVQRLLGRTALGDRVRVGVAEVEVGGGHQQHAEDRQRGEQRRDTVLDDALGPALPEGVAAVAAADAALVELRADRRQHHRQQRDRDRRRDQRDQHAAVADAAQERQRQHDQREQADGDGGAGEDDRPAGGRHGGGDGVLVGLALLELLAPAHDHQQRVVDRDAEPDQRDEELHDRRDLGDRRQAPEQQEGGQDRADRHAQRHQRQRRAEHEDQHDQRAEAADQRLEQHARTVVALARGVVEGVVAGDPQRRALDRDVAQRVAQVSLGIDVGAERVVAAGREDVDEGRAPVLGDEGAVAGGGEAGHARVRHGALGLSLGAQQLRAHARALHGRALGQRHDRHQRQGLAAVAVDPQDLLAGLPALASGHAEALIERFGGRAGGDHPDDGQQQPAERDQALVTENQASQRFHDDRLYHKRLTGPIIES